MSHVLAAFSVNKQTPPTAGYSVDSLGAVRVESEVAGDLTPYLSLVGFGANSADTDVMSGDRDPNGVVSGPPGSIYLRQTGVTSNLYVNVSVGPGPGTSWSPAGSLGAVPTWAAVLGAGNLSGGTDAVMSNGDELRWIDGAAVTRRSDDLVAGEPRTQYFTAAAALAATLSVATPTGVMSYTDDFTLASPSPGLTEGDDTGAPVQRKRKSAGGQAEIEWYSAAALVWQDGVDAAENRWIARTGINFAILLDIVNTTTLNDPFVNLNSPSVIETLGDDAGSPTERKRKSDAGATNSEIYSAGFRRWTWPTVDSAENLYGARYDGVGALVNLFLVAYAASSQTELNDATVWLSNTNPLLLMGTGVGFVIQRINKSDAQEAFGDWDNVFVRRWLFPYFQANENLAEFRYDAAGVFVNVVWEHLAAAQTTQIGETLVYLFAGSVIETLGDGTGSPTRRQNKADAATSTWADLFNAGTRVWANNYDNIEDQTFDRYIGGVFQDRTTISNAAHLWTYPGSSNWASGSPLRTLGTGAGTPVDNFLKADAGEYVATFYSAAQPRWQFPYIPTDESARVSRFSTAGVFVNYTLLFNASDTLAASQTNLSDATIHANYTSVLFVLGDSLGNPTLRTQKDEVGETFFYHYSAGFPRWLFPYVNASEQLAAGRYDAAGVNVNFPLVFDNPGVVTRLNDSTFVYGADSPNTLYGSGLGSPTYQRQKADAGSITDTWVSNAITRGHLLMNAAEEMDWRILTAAGANDTSVRLFAGGIVAMDLPSTQLWVGDWSGNTGSPLTLLFKADAGDAWHRIYSAGLRRSEDGMDAAEDAYWRKYTAAGAIETEVAMFATGFVRMQTHWGVTDAITAPATLAGYAKFFLETGLNGRPQLLEGDSAKEQLGVGITSQAFPVVHRTDTTVSIEDGTETDVLNFTFPANSIGDGGIVFAKIAGLHVADSSTLRLRIYLDASLVFDETSPTLGESGTHVFRTEFFVVNRGTADQVLDGFVELSAADDAATGYGEWGVNTMDSPILGTAGEDTTAATVLRVTLTQTGTAPLTEIYTRHVQLAAPG